MEENSKISLESRKIEDQFIKYKTDLLIEMKADEQAVRDIAELGLLFINKAPDYAGEEQHWSNIPVIAYNSKRYNRIVELLGEKQWDKPENYRLLVYFFGEEKAAYARHAWKQVPWQIYQEGYSRRSYRSPANRVLYLRHQVNFI